MLVPVPFREHKYGLLQCRSFEAFDEFLEILIVFFSFKIKFLTFNLLFKRKPKYACGPNMYVRLLAIFTGKGVKIFM